MVLRCSTDGLAGRSREAFLCRRGAIFAPVVRPVCFEWNRRRNELRGYECIRDVIH
ncbi:hypothetical protein BH24CHL1_BH24CHL1_18600 [soil metagenome]